MLKSFAKIQNNVNNTFEKPLVFLGKISSIIAILAAFFFGGILIYSYIKNLGKKDKKSENDRNKNFFGMILGIIFIFLGIYWIKNFNNKKNLISMAWVSIFNR